jgi:transposase
MIGVLKQTEVGVPGAEVIRKAGISTCRSERCTKPGGGFRTPMVMWVRQIRFAQMAQEATKLDHLHEVEYMGERVARLEQAIVEATKLASPQIQEVVKDLQALRGIAQLSAVTIAAELGNISRFARKLIKKGARLPGCSSVSFSRKSADQIPHQVQETLQPLLRLIQTLSEEIKSYDQRIEKLASEKYMHTKLLRQVNGVGPVTSLAYVLTLETPLRFKRSRDVGPYLGLVPQQEDSGDIQPQPGIISKAGDRMLRKLLVGSAHYILGPFGPDTDLRRFGMKLCQRGGKNAKKGASVAVARKLAVLLHRLWSRGEVYKPLGHGIARTITQSAAA